MLLLLTMKPIVVSDCRVCTQNQTTHTLLRDCVVWFVYVCILLWRLVLYGNVCLLCMHAIVSLSTVVLNSRDCCENVWLPKIMCLEKQPIKITMQKPLTTL